MLMSRVNRLMSTRRTRGPGTGKTAVGLDRAAFAFHGEHHAGKDRLAVEQHGAGAALPELAAVLGPGELEVLAQDLEQRLVDGRQDLAVLAVHPELEERLHPCSHLGRRPGTIAFARNFDSLILNRHATCQPRINAVTATAR